MRNKSQKILVVGAGLAGSTVARILADAGQQVSVIDKREHIAGNAFDYVGPEGIRIHKYGPHIFHTSNKEVFDFLSRFTEWLPYKHKVKALLHDGREVPLPPNKETLSMLTKSEIIDQIFRPYTKKMWDKEIEELDPEILNRVKIRDDFSDFYFPDDTFQYMPKLGYTHLVGSLLDNKNINIRLKTNFQHDHIQEYDYIFNSMPIDEFFDFKFGELPYRSIKITTVTLPHPNINSVATVNFTHSGPHTRVTEWKKFPGHGKNEFQTVLTFEEPCDYRENHYERYYPVKDLKGKNREIYARYKSIVPKNVEFIGRCGLYAYLDMHQAVSSSLATANRFLAK